MNQHSFSAHKRDIYCVGRAMKTVDTVFEKGYPQRFGGLFERFAFKHAYNRSVEPRQRVIEVPDKKVGHNLVHLYPYVFAAQISGPLGAFRQALQD